MLVLSRKKNESIVIGGNIVVTVVEVRGNSVRLGIDAPADVVVHREEVQRLIERSSARKLQTPSMTSSDASGQEMMLA